MFRLVDDAFEENNELHTIAVYCLTETIKIHLEKYFEEGYSNEEDKMLYMKVKLDEAYELFPDELVNSMISVGVNVSLFITKKIAQFMLLLKKSDEETPDIFNEYILYRMIIKQSKSYWDYTSKEIDDEKVKLKKLLRTYAKDELEINDVKELNKFVKDNTRLLTEFTSLLGVKESNDESYVFWDWDFDFFDQLGFENMIKQLTYGILSQRGYGVDYTKSIFTDIDEEVPFDYLE